MKSLRVSRPGATPMLDSLDRPAPGEGQVLIKVEACALNFADLLLIEGTYQVTPSFPLTPGMEIAGTVEEVGSGVKGFKLGDKVISYCGHGGLSNFTAVDAHRVLQRPGTMDALTGAAFQIAYATSHLALRRRARLAKGETLVVLGAAGGVGLTAVEIGHHLGARVIAVARGSDRLKVAANAGAHILIDSSDVEGLRDALAEHAPFDVVYDAVGGDPGNAAARLLRPEGRHLLIGFASGSLPTLRPNHMLVKNIATIGLNIAAYPDQMPDAFNGALDELMQWHARGLIKPHISHRFPLDDAAKALQCLRDRRATGKIVVTP